ncbi:phosphatidylinositol mannoside acyltransferase [Nocardioides iriomotensis]|uniref:Phosphatidylinositol mannoside acyltransferase n=1 Tax=Nocardioides iriomotensis TaxID=715784 RepID=A0A4Q5J0L8_9ACTN|nr:phosphatidylinositol mannoside acyltransferase [Nocardioides iriomotensis]RYU10939.1 phosphatidylinositol mannoside acyltransferase [Nocardioides iriomotensis]
MDVQGGLRRAVSAASGHGVTAAYLTGWRAVRLLPEPAARATFDRIADGIHARDGRSVQRLRANLARTVPADDLDATVRAGVRSYLRYWCESFRLPSWDIDDVVARTRVRGEERLRGPVSAGRGVVAALPHMGNWDWAGAWACATGMPVTTVAERLEPTRLYDEFVAFRAGLGMEILPLTGGPPPLRRLIDAVREGRLVCLLADRDLSRGGVDVDLLGEPARMPRGPAVLARATGVDLVPVTLAYRGRDLELTFHPPVPHAPGDDGIVAMMQGVADAFSAGIAADPVDWHMMQKVFVADLAPRPPRPSRDGA